MSNFSFKSQESFHVHFFYPNCLWDRAVLQPHVLNQVMFSLLRGY